MDMTHASSASHDDLGDAAKNAGVLEMLNRCLEEADRVHVGNDNNTTHPRKAKQKRKQVIARRMVEEKYGRKGYYSKASEALRHWKTREIEIRRELADVESSTATCCRDININDSISIKEQHDSPSVTSKKIGDESSDVISKASSNNDIYNGESSSPSEDEANNVAIGLHKSESNGAETLCEHNAHSSETKSTALSASDNTKFVNGPHSKSAHGKETAHSESAAAVDTAALSERTKRSEELQQQLRGCLRRQSQAKERLVL